MFQRKNKPGSYDPNDKRPIFIQSNKLFFAYSGGRLIIMNDQLQWQDLGDGKGRSDNSGTIQHEFLGQIKGEGLCLTFKKYNTTFDFNTLKNCHFLENNKIKGKREADYYMYPIHHLKRYAKKRLNKI